MEFTPLTAQVANAPLSLDVVNLTIDRAEIDNGFVAHLDDGNTLDAAVQYSARIDWGDGTRATVGMVSGSGGSFDIHGSHYIQYPGVYQFHVTVHDKDCGTVAGSGTIVVTSDDYSGADVGVASAVKGGPTAPVLTVVHPLPAGNREQLFVQGFLDVEVSRRQKLELEFFAIRGDSERRLGSLAIRKRENGPVPFSTVLDAVLVDGESVVARARLSWLSLESPP